MAEPDEVWLPLVDEPIGSIVERIQHDNADIERLVRSPRRVLAFRTFAYIRVGLVLGQLLFDDEIEQYDGSDEWVERLLANPAHAQALEDEVRAVAQEVAADPKYSDEELLGPDEAARDRFRDFARKQLE